MLLILTVGTANAHSPFYSGFCGNREEIVKQLLEQYNETPIGIAETYNGDVLEIFSSPNGDTYSIIATKKNNEFTCFVSTGLNLKLRPLPVDSNPSKNGDA